MQPPCCTNLTPAWIDISITKKKLMGIAPHTDNDTMSQAMTLLESQKVWEATASDYARTTELLVYDKGALQKLLPQTLIAEKKDREERRLHAMLQYSKLERGHGDFIRNYFLHPENFVSWRVVSGIS